MLKGYVQVYTGDGKGKTTAALGLALRAVGYGFRVLMIQFMKGKSYGELKAAPRLAPLFTIVQMGKPYFLAREGEVDPELAKMIGDGLRVFKPGNPPHEYVEITRKGIELAREALHSGKYDMIILDEVNMAVHFELIPKSELLALIDEKPAGVELVLTGRRALPEVVERAQLVTEMKEVKNYFTEGVTARDGVEQ